MSDWQNYRKAAAATWCLSAVPAALILALSGRDQWWLAAACVGVVAAAGCVLAAALLAWARMG